MNIGKEELDFVYELAYGYALGMGLDEAGAKKHADSQQSVVKPTVQRVRCAKPPPKRASVKPRSVNPFTRRPTATTSRPLRAAASSIGTLARRSLLFHAPPCRSSSTGKGPVPWGW